jgi:PAS domain S-box-containing protein
MTVSTLAVLESLGVIAVAVDRQGAVIDWTGGFLALSGRPPDELRGRLLWEFASPNDQERLQQALLETAIDRRLRQVDAAMTAGSDQRRIAWLCLFVSHTGDDSIVAWGIDAAAAASTVATPGRGLHRELAAREQELSAIYENVPGIMFYVAVEPDGEFRFLSMSHAGLVATGLTREQFFGSRVRDVIPLPSRDLVLNHYREAIRSAHTVRWKETSTYPAGRRVGEVAVTPLYDASGVATHLIGIVHDITERERLEDALHQREERLAFLLRLNDALRPLSDPVEIQDVTVRLLGEHLRVNRVAYSEIDGEDYIVKTSYNHGVDPVRGRGPIRPYGAKLFEAYRRGEAVSVSDVRTDSRFTDAERANLLALGMVAFLRVMLHKEGRWVASLGVNSLTPRDWTDDEVTLLEEAAERMWSAAERSHAEAALREREWRLQLALDASGAGSWTRETGANHVDWDEGFNRLYQFAPEEPHTFERWLSRIHEEDRAKVFDLVDETRRPKKDAWDITFRAVRPDGTMVWVQSLGRVERDSEGAVTRLAGLEMDITARRCAEEMVQARRDEEHHHELKLLLETATQGVVSVDAAGTIVTANQAIETMFGWAPGELIGQSIERLLPSSMRGAYMDTVAGFFAAPRPRALLTGPNFVGERKDGSTFPVELSLNYVASPSGGHAFAFVTDITERQRAATALQERTVELERRSAQLSRLASDLTLAEQHAREQLAKTLHDGLQQMLALAAIHIEQQMNRDSRRDGPPPLLVQAKRQLDEAIAAARSLSVELSPPLLHSAGLPAALTWLADWSHRKYGLKVHVSADPLADSTRKDVCTLLFESVRELLFNAVKHAQVDRVSVDLTREPGDMIAITVTDQGIGFDPAELIDRVKAGQVGWGLFSIRERLMLLGGLFEIESTPGRGTRFRLIVPAGTAPDSIDVESLVSHAVIGPAFGDAAGVASASALRILIVDDHTAVRRALRDVLQARPEFQIAGEAANGHEAIDQARALRPDAILMDVSMPEMDGVEATRHMHAEFPLIHILGLSMYPRTEDYHPIEQAGAERFFTKGVDTQRLIDHLLVMHRGITSGYPGSRSGTVASQPARVRP